MRPVLAEMASFLELYFIADEGGQAQFAKHIYGAGRPHLSFDQLRSVLVPIPPLAEQARIVDAVSRIESDVGAVLAAAHASARDAGALRQRVLSAAFTGDLCVQNPAEEPASVLLEHPRDLRAAAV